MLKVFKYRLCPTENQEILINKHIGASRFIYNLALETKKYAYNSNKINLSRYDLSAQLVDLKNEATWLKEINYQTIQQTLLRLEKRQCQDVENSSVDERPSGPKKHLVSEALKVLDYGLETTKSLV